MYRIVAVSVKIITIKMDILSNFLYELFAEEF